MRTIFFDNRSQLIPLQGFWKPFLKYPAQNPIFTCFSLIFLSQIIFAQPAIFNHPELKWETIETEHFLVHYHQGTVRTANTVAQIAEEIYPHITGLYQYEPKKKVEFIIRDTDDYANGAAYFYDNKVEIWAENLDYIFRGTHNWLRDVVTHEYTHIISLQNALKFGRHVPAGWLQLFAYETERRPDVVRGFPNVIVSYPVSGITIPVWFAEGVSQYQSPSKKYDYRDSHREMILRDRVLTGKLLDYDEMSVFGKNSIGNESSYNQGFAFVNYLTENFGDTVVAKMTETSKSATTLDFKGVIKKTTGMEAQQIFENWNGQLRDRYESDLEVVSRNIFEGQPIESEGMANLSPMVSPDGKKVAFTASHKSDYLSQNALEVMDILSGERTTITGRVFSSITWSPDSRYLAYSKQTKLQPNGSSFNDLYIYDLKKKKQYQITNAMRARNPDWSHDGKKLAFVIAGDGGTNLFSLELDDLNTIKIKGRYKTVYYDLNNHQIVESLPVAERKNWKYSYRKIEYWGKSLKQLTHFNNGRQIYHPRWSLDDTYLIFDTSIAYGRDIARVPSNGGEMTFVLNSRCDERYPIFHPANGELYFSCDETGIFNIYSLDLDTGKRSAHTNVVGGAFMPTVTPENDLYYSSYKNQGYKLYRIQDVNAVNNEYLVYRKSYEEDIPELKVDDSVEQPLQSKDYTRRFAGISVMPRLMVDYGTLKPGFYLYANEIIDKMDFFSGFDINFRGEYDIFALFDFRLWKPTLFINFFNQTAEIEDDFNDPFYVSDDKIKTNFNLLEADVGLRGQALAFFGFDLFSFFNWELSYIFSLYKAKIGTFAYRELSTGQTFVSPPIRYTYLKGHTLKLLLRHSAIKPDVDVDINPRKGRYVTLSIRQEWNKFLDDFATDRVVGIEEFTDYNYRSYEINWEEYFRMPGTERHTLSFRFQGGYIDQEVNDFFHFFAGGLVGLKGYPYYSIQGSKKMIGSFTYRLPLFRNINKQFLNVYFNKLFVGAIYQIGDAWSEGGVEFNNFKSDVGLQLRLETFSWYLFPTRIFFEAVRPLKEHLNKYTGITYEKDWKFYFGILFDFDLRLENGLRRVL